MKLAIIDDHAIVLEGFKRLLEVEHHEIVFTAESFTQAKALIAGNQMDIAIIDLSLGDQSGLGLIAEVKKHHKDAKVLVTSMYNSDPYVSQAISRGADGYLSKNTAAQELSSAITTLSAGRSFLGSDVINNIRLTQNTLEDSLVTELTNRELDIFKLLAVGYSIKTVSSQLDIMPKTVHAHKANILLKLGVRETFDLLKIALKVNLVSLKDITN